MKEDQSLDLGAALGATGSASVQVLTLFVPSHDRAGKRLRSQKRWVEEAAELLARIGGGVTVSATEKGGWLDPKTDEVVWEKPKLVWTYIREKQFLEHLTDLRAFLHRLGWETRQGEVAVEFDGNFYRIDHFDKEVHGGCS